METPALPRRLALTAGCNQLINWGSPLHAGNLCSCHYSRPKLVVPEIYLGLTLAMLVMAIVSPFVAPSAGAFWWTKGGNERDLADRRKLSVNGLYAHTFRLVWRPVADRHRDAPVAV